MRRRRGRIARLRRHRGRPRMWHRPRRQRRRTRWLRNMWRRRLGRSRARRRRSILRGRRRGRLRRQERRHRLLPRLRGLAQQGMLFRHHEGCCARSRISLGRRATGTRLPERSLTGLRWRGGTFGIVAATARWLVHRHGRPIIAQFEDARAVQPSSQRPIMSRLSAFELYSSRLPLSRAAADSDDLISHCGPGANLFLKAQSTGRRKISDALVPPNPKELDSATLISRLRALCGTRSIGVSTDGLSRLMVGGAT